MPKTFSHSYPRLASRPAEKNAASSEAIVIPDTVPFGLDEMDTLPMDMDPQDLMQKFNAEMPPLQETPSEPCVP